MDTIEGDDGGGMETIHLVWARRGVLTKWSHHVSAVFGCPSRQVAVLVTLFNLLLSCLALALLHRNYVGKADCLPKMLEHNGTEFQIVQIEVKTLGHFKFIVTS